jgi:proteasome lid subunit RPN8/RPN11
MIGFIRRAISATVAPRARLRLSSGLFSRVVGEIHRRGEEKRESGAFLLGSITPDGVRTIDEVVYYEDLDPYCTRTGAIALGPQAFAEAWRIASHRGRQVVADVHSHPGRSEQSWIDRSNPAVALAGHVALIVPEFGRHGATRLGLGVFEYLGGHRWRVVADSEKSQYLEIGWWVS